LRKIDLIFFDAGGAHRSAATALKAAMEAQPRPWEIRLVSLQDVLDPVDVFRKATGVPLQDFYNFTLARGWTWIWGVGYGLRLLRGVVRLIHGPMVQLLRGHWLQSRPDLVVSLVPIFNRALRESLHSTLPAVPFTTSPIDLADCPPHFWMERQEQFMICGTEKALEQALAQGLARERIFRTSGMILRPKFYEPVTADRAAERKRLGLDPERPTGLVLFGSQGSKAMLRIAQRLPDTQSIFLCGRNATLATRIEALPRKAPWLVERFTSDIPYYMHLADFFVGKPGSGCVSEAVEMKLPVIVERNCWTLPWERYNAAWVVERKLGIVLRDFRQIANAVERMIENLDGFRANVEKIRNRALFEVPEILEKIAELPVNRPFEKLAG
jgi:hypothetical protein